MRSRRGEGGGRQRGGLLSKGLKGLAGGIGLATESYAAHKEGKEQKKMEEEQRNSSVSNSSTSGSKQELPYHPKSDGQGPPPSYDAGPNGYSGQNGYEGEKHQYQDGKGQHPEDIDYDDAEEEDELWALDDAQHSMGEHHDSRPVPAGALEDEFIRHHPPPRYTEKGRLPMPVVLPQRRPKDRSRGFVRAYAPVLADCGIDQAAWLEFLEKFDKDSQASGWCKAINMAQFATINMPGVTGMVVGNAIDKGAKAATEASARDRTNKFLFKINQEFFQPRGLYCLVMTWNPNSNSAVENMDLNSTIANNINGQAGKYRDSDGQGYSEWEFPETAPLVFPKLDEIAAAQGEDAKKQGKKAFVADYWDRRAQAEAAGNNPNSPFANMPQQKFSSAYADPNSSASSGSLIGFVTGGKMGPKPGESKGRGGLLGGMRGGDDEDGGRRSRRGGRRGGGLRARRAGGGMEEEDGGMGGGLGGGRRERRGGGRRAGGGGRGGLGGATKKFLNQNVLYMMVVNMPDDNEMAEAANQGAFDAPQQQQYPTAQGGYGRPSPQQEYRGGYEQGPAHQQYAPQHDRYEQGGYGYEQRGPPRQQYAPQQGYGGTPQLYAQQQSYGRY